MFDLKFERMGKGSISFYHASDFSICFDLIKISLPSYIIYLLPLEISITLHANETSLTKHPSITEATIL